MKFFPALLSASALALIALPAQAQEAPGWLGTYGGSYLCQDGEHGFYLNIEEATATATGHDVSGVLGFFPTLAGQGGSSSGVSGSFQVSGTIASDGAIMLTAGEWLVRAENYGAANLEGNVSSRGAGLWQIIGAPVIPGNPDACSGLIATQFLP